MFLNRFTRNCTPLGLLCACFVSFEIEALGTLEAKADFNRNIYNLYRLGNADKDIGFGIWNLRGDGNCSATILHTRGGVDNATKINFRLIEIKSIESMSASNTHIGISLYCRVRGCMKVYDTDADVSKRLGPSVIDDELFTFKQRDLKRAIFLIRSIGQECGFSVPNPRLY